MVCAEVGLFAWSEGFLCGLVDDLINKKTEKGYVMIEVRKDE
jgi:hypothetical protein